MQKSLEEKIAIYFWLLKTAIIAAIDIAELGSYNYKIELVFLCTIDKYLEQGLIKRLCSFYLNQL